MEGGEGMSGVMVQKGRTSLLKDCFLSQNNIQSTHETNLELKKK